MAATSPRQLRLRVTELARDRSRHANDLAAAERGLQAARDYLAIAPRVEQALDSLSQKLFDEVVGVLQEKLTIALQEVLEQPIRLKAESTFKWNATNIEFFIERDGQHEDIMRGQGGSVANVLSVGLRLFALMTLDPRVHRRFLVLDEQDCWLRPDLVPRLVKIIHDAGHALGFQVLLISHHDVSAFDRFADRIYHFLPQADGTVKVVVRNEQPMQCDESASPVNGASS